MSVQQALTMTDIFSMFDHQDTYESLIHPMVEFSFGDLFNRNRKPWFYKIAKNKNTEPKYNLDEGSNEYNPYGKGKQKNTNIQMSDLTDELPEYNINDLNGDTNVLDYFSYYRFAINAVIVAFPWTILALTCLFYNLYFNFAWNKIWATANFYLVSNTLYLLV